MPVCGETITGRHTHTHTHTAKLLESDIAIKFFKLLTNHSPFSEQQQHYPDEVIIYLFLSLPGCRSGSLPLCIFFCQWMLS